jgi:hypothetical protein
LLRRGRRFRWRRIGSIFGAACTGNC